VGVLAVEVAAKALSVEAVRDALVPAGAAGTFDKEFVAAGMLGAEFVVEVLRVEVVVGVADVEVVVL
jgi:hypothetical protein